MRPDVSFHLFDGKIAPCWRRCKDCVDYMDCIAVFLQLEREIGGRDTTDGGRRGRRATGEKGSQKENERRFDHGWRGETSVKAGGPQKETKGTKA